MPKPIKARDLSEEAIRAGLREQSRFKPQTPGQAAAHHQHMAGLHHRLGEENEARRHEELSKKFQKRTGDNMRIRDEHLLNAARNIVRGAQSGYGTGAGMVQGADEERRGRLHRALDHILDSQRSVDLAAFTGASGKIHPIRNSEGYNPRKAGEKAKKGKAKKGKAKATAKKGTKAKAKRR